jgi:16S rRNA (guanine966-N2)-methyltransferase
MRIIAGSLRSRRLVSPPDLKIRPTRDAVRESLFNVLGEKVRDCRFLDLFSGTGAVGIEALSRGASSCVFVESHASSLDVLNKNISKFSLWDYCRVFGEPVEIYLEGTPDDHDGPFDIVFADPPYEYNGRQISGLLSSLGEGWLSPGGILVFERPATDPDEAFEALTGFSRVKRSGSTALVFSDFDHLMPGRRGSP